MRKIYCAFVVVLLVLVCSAASPVRLKRVRLESAGTISIPASWNVIAESSPVSENAYGQGVSGRSLLTARNDDGSTLAIFTYWPAPNKTSSEVAKDVSKSLRGISQPSRFDKESEMQFGNIRASIISYPLDGGIYQKVTAFIHGGKIYCAVINYRPDDEYEITNLVRRIINYWRF